MQETDNGPHTRTDPLAIALTFTNSAARPAASPSAARKRLMEYALALAVLAALAGACTHNVTAAALLASFVLSSALRALDAPFDLVQWLMMDLTVIFVIAAVAIMHWQFRYSDAAIIALFLPAWMIYTTQPPWASLGVDTLVAAQLFLTFPVAMLPALWHRVPEFRREFTKYFGSRDEVCWA